MPNSIRIVAFEDDGHWVAQCLEHDIRTQAADYDTLHRRMRLTLQAEHEACLAAGNTGLDCLPKAPDRFFHMWNDRVASAKAFGRFDGVSYEFALCA